jgi:hypothetical protein
MKLRRTFEPDSIEADRQINRRREGGRKRPRRSRARRIHQRMPHGASTPRNPHPGAAPLPKKQTTNKKTKQKVNKRRRPDKAPWKRYYMKGESLALRRSLPFANRRRFRCSESKTGRQLQRRLWRFFVKILMITGRPGKANSVHCIGGDGGQTSDSENDLADHISDRWKT